MSASEFYLNGFVDSSVAHIALAVYLFVIMDEKRCRMLRKLPALVLSPALAVMLNLLLYKAFTAYVKVVYYATSIAIVLLCTLWVRWAWRVGFWQALAAVCMAGMFQVAVSSLCGMLFRMPASNEDMQFMAATVIYFMVALCSAALLRCLHFGTWFRLLLEEDGQWKTALLLSVMVGVMEVFCDLQRGILPDYLLSYYLLGIALAVLMATLVVYLARRLDAVRKIEMQQDVIARQQLYEQDLESIRREVRAFRHDYKNLLAGLSAQAGAGEMEALLTSLDELDAGFDRRVGEKIRISTQIGNLRMPQMRGLLLSKMAAMGEKGVDCRLEAIYPVERVGMDSWDYVRCLGILLDNAAEAALETETPWVEVVLLARENSLSLRVSNPYVGTIDPDRIWTEGFSTKGEGRGLGLPGYQRIVAACPGAASSTSWAAGVFVQELTVEDRS